MAAQKFTLSEEGNQQMHRGKLLVVALFVCVWPLVLCKGNETPESEERKAKEIQLDLRYDFTVPGKTSKVKFIVALPKTIPDRQQISIKYTPEPSKYIKKDGNRYAAFIFIRPRKRFKVEIIIRAKLFKYDLLQARSKQKKRLFKGHGFSDFLKHEKYIEKDDPLIQQIAEGISSKDEIETVNRIFDYVTENMEYGGYYPEALGALQAAKNKKGDCTEYTDLFVALCRAKKLPAKAICGYATEFVGTPKHAWAEVYLKEYGWTPFDPTWGDVKHKSAWEFYNLQSVYIYFYHTRNDKILEGGNYYRYWWWGDAVKVEDSIEFKNKQL